MKITESNSLLRSAYQIALREGKETNWQAFKNSVYAELVKEYDNGTYLDVEVSTGNKMPPDNNKQIMV